jgi:CO dehydrogenase maturation factor
MGVFHCPFGCPFYDDTDCIDCGMCLATTEKEMVEASKKIRAYLKTHAAKKSGVVKKIAVCGKGGVGKSTVVALISKSLESKGYNVLVVDTDESNPGLYRMFALTKEPKALLTVLERFSGKANLSNNWLKRDAITLQDIPEDYVISGKSHKFMMVGKIEDPFQGCACSMADITRSFVEKLVLKDKEILIIDMEAGIESFGRGVERSVDTVLIVVEPSFESITLAEKIYYMAQGMGINRVKALLNKIPSSEIASKLKNRLGNEGICVIGSIYYNSDIFHACFEGRPIYGMSVKEIDDITEILLFDGN